MSTQALHPTRILTQTYTHFNPNFQESNSDRITLNILRTNLSICPGLTLHQRGILIAVLENSPSWGLVRTVAGWSIEDEEKFRALAVVCEGGFRGWVGRDGERKGREGSASGSGSGKGRNGDEVDWEMVHREDLMWQLGLGNLEQEARDELLEWARRDFLERQSRWNTGQLDERIKQREGNTCLITGQRIDRSGGEVARIYPLETLKKGRETSTLSKFLHLFLGPEIFQHITSLLPTGPSNHQETPQNAYYISPTWQRALSFGTITLEPVPSSLVFKDGVAEKYDLTLRLHASSDYLKPYARTSRGVGKDGETVLDLKPGTVIRVKNRGGQKTELPSPLLFALSNLIWHTAGRCGLVPDSPPPRGPQIAETTTERTRESVAGATAQREARQGGAPELGLVKPGAVADELIAGSSRTKRRRSDSDSEEAQTDLPNRQVRGSHPGEDLVKRRTPVGSEFNEGPLEERERDIEYGTALAYFSIL